jgi:DNA-binding NtrC family response regulator
VFHEEAKIMARSGRTILVVSDDPVTVFSTWAILFNANYRVHVASGRARAGKLSKATIESIDVAIIDVRTADVNPSRLAAQLQAKRPGLKVLYLSSVVEGGIVRCGISKLKMLGFEKEGLLGSVRKCLRQSERKFPSPRAPKTMMAGR